MMLYYRGKIIKISIILIVIYLVYEIVTLYQFSQNEQSKILILVKTSNKFHSTRVQLILDSWYKHIPKTCEFNFLTDNQTSFRLYRNNLFIGSECGGSHSRLHLCCKTHNIFQYIIRRSEESKFGWSCIFDDDQYVNIRTLLSVLDVYDEYCSKHKCYIGKLSWNKKVVRKWPLEFLYKNKQQSFSFGTLGAGVCLHKNLFMDPIWIKEFNKFFEYCSNLKLPDDMTIGYINEVLLGTKVINERRLHSHLEWLHFENVVDNKTFLESQISYGYGLISTKSASVRKFVKNKNIQNKTIFNRIPLKKYLLSNDRTGMISIDNLLYPKKNQNFIEFHNILLDNVPSLVCLGFRSIND
ncbi:hypothetical protein SNEBB_007678 [Seison nebaliae]|nr:hypothetical protein SNEBB_007678 [Seison nebaliae]